MPIRKVEVLLRGKAFILESFRKTKKKKGEDRDRETGGQTDNISLLFSSLLFSSITSQGAFVMRLGQLSTNKQNHMYKIDPKTALRWLKIKKNSDSVLRRQ